MNPIGRSPDPLLGSDVLQAFAALVNDVQTHRHNYGIRLPDSSTWGHDLLNYPCLGPIQDNKLIGYTVQIREASASWSA